MSAKYLMCLDVGTSGGRAVLVNSDTRAVTAAYRTWSHPVAPDSGGWGYDLDTVVIWKALGSLAREVLAKTGASADEVAGIAATSMRHGIVLVDKSGSVLFAVPNKDARAASEAMAMGDERGAELYNLTGHFPSPVLMGPRLVWMSQNAPALLEKAAACFSISDWVGFMLCGAQASEGSQAGETLLLDLKTRTWSDEILRSLKLPAGILPPVVPGGIQLGGLTPQAAEHLGLKAGTPVGAGGGDTQSCLLGLGITTPGQLGVAAGSTVPLMQTCTEMKLDAQMRTWTGLHIVPGLFVVESNAGGMGTALEWFAGVLYTEHPRPVAALAGDAVSGKPSGGGIISTIGSTVFNAAAMNIPIDALTFSCMAAEGGSAGRANIARAVLEGMAYTIRANAVQCSEVTGTKPDSVLVGGGMSRSELWTQIISDVMDKPVQVSAAPESTGVGGAICAAVAAGLFPDLASATNQLLQPMRQHQPEAGMTGTFQGYYNDWSSFRLEKAPADAVAGGIVLGALMGSDNETSVGAAANLHPRIFVSADAGEDAIAMLRALGEVTYSSYRDEGRVLTDDDLVAAIKDYQVLVTEVDVVNASVLRALPNLRLVVVCRGNPVNIDISACTAAGVPVINTPGRNADAVADLAVSFMLMLGRKLNQAITFLHEPGGEAGDMGRMGQAYLNYRGNELWHKTIGIIGAGAIGRRVIRRVLPFEAHVLVFDPYITAEQAAVVGAEKVSLQELLERSDFISLHAAVTDETRNLIDAAAFARMKPGAFLVNTARAALVDQEALLAALQAGKLGGAALDVFAVEPPGADDPLLAFPNVIATPHVGGNTNEVGIHQGMIILDELQRLLNGKAPKYILNPETLKHFTWTEPRHMDEAALANLTAGPGPALRDLELKEKMEERPAAVPSASKAESAAKSGGLLSGFKKMFTKGDEIPTPPPAATPPPTATNAGAGVQKYNLLLEKMLAFMESDGEILAFSRGKNVTFQFTLKDIGTRFFMSFADGTVKAALGDAPVKPEVNLKMSADTFDGMFTGRINPSKAAMSGKLSFSGDTTKAMAMQKLNISGVYAKARAEVGDPGDLTQLSAAPASTPAAVAASPAGGVAPATPALIHRVGDIRDELLDMTNEMFAKGFLTAIGGNISVRDEKNPNEVWITPSSIFKGGLQANMMVKIDLQSNLIGDSDYSASSERRVHCGFYRKRPEVMAVIHSHARYATLMGMAGITFLPLSTEAAFIGDVPVVPFLMPGTDDLGNAVDAAIGEKTTALIMQNHGLVVAGSSLRRAADMTEVVEITAEKLLWCKAMGVAPSVLPDDLVETLRDMGNMVA